MSADTLAAIANQLVEYCRAGHEDKALSELYAEDATSVEAAAAPGADSAETKGLDGIRGKHEWWANAMESHGGAVDGPYLHGTDRFGVIFEIDATVKATGERNKMKEIGVYTVANGKIVREEFFYTR
ncbi:MAG: nuclear transport factor 2 family protein [Pseudomonadota bacterium]